MKFIVKLMLLLMVSNLFSQIDSIKTEEHYTLPGTRFAIILPDVSFSNATSYTGCLLYTSPSPRDKRQSRMPSSA